MKNKLYFSITEDLLKNYKSSEYNGIILIGSRGTGKSWSTTVELAINPILTALTKKKVDIPQSLFITRSERQTNIFLTSFQQFFPLELRSGISIVKKDASIYYKPSFHSKKVLIAQVFNIKGLGDWKALQMPLVKYIIWDEYGIEFEIGSMNIKYLRNEFSLLSSFYTTIARNRNDVKIIIISNPITFQLPIFEDIGLRKQPREGKANIIKTKQGFKWIVMNVVPKPALKAKQRETGQYKFNSIYSSYAYHNKILNERTFCLVPDGVFASEELNYVPNKFKYVESYVFDIGTLKFYYTNNPIHSCYLVVLDRNAPIDDGNTYALETTISLEANIPFLNKDEFEGSANHYIWSRRNHKIFFDHSIARDVFFNILEKFLDE